MSGTAVYCATGHSEWITRLPQAARPAMELLYLELDALTELRKRAEKELITEARRHREYRILKSCRAGSDPHAGAVGHRGHTVSVRQQAGVLELLWTGDRDAELVGLGAHERWGVDQGAGAADTRAESEFQPHVEACVQGCGNDGDRAWRGRTPVPALPTSIGRRHKAELSEADNCASDRFHSALALAQRRGVQPEETRDGGGVNRCLIGEVASDADNARSTGSETQRLQGRASKQILVPASWPESPRIGYAPLESRTKRWATESLIEGWFPLPSGERIGCEVLRHLATRALIEHSTPGGLE